MHHEGDEYDDNAMDPFRDDDDDMDDDDEADVDVVQDLGRGSWWRGMVGKKSRADDDSDDADVDDDDDEFGDFAMAEDDQSGGTSNREQLVLRPLAINPAKEGSRGLSGLWPFGSRNESSKAKRGEGSHERADDLVASADEKKEEGYRAIEVREATRRTSIEEPDEEEIVVGK
ncbi:uncharacterized protein MAM_07804 [Metarhizium album ARSEF 1941]|uniref:SIT4 phosphatase-associated protein n=1 Tax=Metarhizium album (strain ARSEF 1941) TaxID=1081103 RepID=A0A0B2WMY5_METAS|nr:uncharacterized protein MAM_07804 [Metarhizium album ARSEF 1941]KHN94375.1 hypothetical protein MAM_07804 [Metarhizium album ARSEF 1941]